MADTKLSNLSALTSVATNDYVEVLDVSDTVTMAAASGANKKVLQSDFLAGVYRQGGGTVVAVSDGGTGSTAAINARGSLGLGIGTAVQAWDADLDAFAALTSGANLFPYYTGTNTMGTADFLNWGTWAPVWANLGPGNPGGAGTATYQYAQIGKTVIARFTLTLGITGTVGTNPTLNLPVTADATQTANVTGLARFNSGGTIYMGHMAYFNAGTATMKSWNSAATSVVVQAVSATLPGTWAAGDNITGQMVYRAA